MSEDNPDSSQNNVQPINNQIENATLQSQAEDTRNDEDAQNEDVEMNNAEGGGEQEDNADGEQDGDGDAIEEQSGEQEGDAAESEEQEGNGNEEQDENVEGEQEEADRSDLPEFVGNEEEVETEPVLDNKDMTEVLQVWDNKRAQASFDPVPILKRLAEIFERETDIYMRKDPDPLDERHPYRSDPSCQFGFLLKQLFRKEVFMNKLVNDYLRENYFTRQNIQRSALELNILACRLILVLMPGLETSAVFQVDSESLLQRIYSWAEDSIEPLQSYAAGLLAAAMEVADIAITFREANTRLVPKMIKRLHMMQAMYKSSKEAQQQPTNGTASAESSFNNSDTGGLHRILPNWMSGESAPQSPDRVEESANSGAARTSNSIDAFATNSTFSTLFENSRDAFANIKYKKTYIPIHPPTAESSQMLIMRYLTTMGEYQEYLAMVFEQNVMQLIFGYIEKLDRHDTCLAFEALKYLASLLCHKKFALEFISHGGLERLLKVPRPSIASTGVSITLYYLSYSEDAMERICTMPKPVITDLVRYALWILGRSYDSGKCHATMFFGLSFQFKVILDEFDAQDGLRKLYNVISILKILNASNNDNDDTPINEDVECASRQLVRHVCVAMKRYMESHLFFKYNNFLRQQCLSTNDFSHNVTVASKASLDQISEQIRTLQESTYFLKAQWEPVNNLLKLGGITLLLKIISFAYEWNNSGRSETVRSALDVISICCVIPKVFESLYDRLELPDNFTTITGITSILGAAAGDITADADVQKSALAVLIHCVCAPLTPKSEVPTVAKGNSAAKRLKLSSRYPDWLIEKVWDSVCANNGIIVLLSLMQVKTPITDADCIRGMACRALAGLARSERVRQIIGKLPMFASGQIQTLMRDPILQEKRSEHVLFQKYALELLERVSGKSKPISNQLDASLANIHKANVVAQTKIQYNEQQLYQLIHEHLESKGLSQTAQMLKKEANLQVPSQAIKNFHQSPFDYKVLSTSSITRNRLRSRMQDVNLAINSAGSASTSNEPASIALNGSFSDECLSNGAANTPIKIVRKVIDKINTPVSSASVLGPSTSSAISNQRSMQKQITSEANLSEECNSPAIQNAGITLSTIVTEYLTNQHALCKNPMSTCPQFDLFTPHKCPDPKPSRLNGPNMNITSNIFKAQSGYNASRAFRRYVHSNFDCLRTIRSTDVSENGFTCCEIVSNANLILVGMNQGEVKAFNINDGTEQFQSICHSYIIDAIKSNRAGDLVVTCSSWRTPKSVLWRISNNEFESKLRFSEEHYCEFSNQTQDKILGTQTDCAIIYDLNKESKVSTFKPFFGNQYTKNHATFNPTDEIILSDGVLWDVRSCKEIHKFDKLNTTLSGVFHPNGLEIISNTEIWDLRTFHLLQTVPVLDQCQLAFSPMNVMYGFSLETDKCTDFEDTTTYDTSFKILDSFDYSSISTIDVKKNINDLSVNSNGSLIALVELQPPFDSKEETFVKLYAVGAKKSDQQEEEEDEEADTEEDGSDFSDVTALLLRSTTDRLGEAGGGNERRRRRRRNFFDFLDAQVFSDAVEEEDEEDDDDNDGGDFYSSDGEDDFDDDNDNDDDDDGSDQWIRLSSSSDEQEENRNSNDEGSQSSSSNDDGS